MINFECAAKRHFHDGLLLKKENRDPNAGQLFGFAAECGIKSLLVACGYPTSPDGDLGTAGGGICAKKHIHQFVPMMAQLSMYLAGRNGSKYLSQIPNIADFSNWHTDQRYYTDQSIPTFCNKWQDAAKEVMNMLQNLAIDKGLTCP